MAGMLGVSSDAHVFRQVWQRSTGLTPALTRQLGIQSAITTSLFSAFFLSTTARPFDPL